MNSKLFILSKCDYTWTKHHLGWSSSQCQKTFFCFLCVTLSWDDHIKTRFVSHGKKFVSLCLCQEVPLPISPLRGCLWSSIIVVRWSTWSRGAHQFIYNMKSYRTWKPRIRAKLWVMSVSAFVPRGGKVRDENDERQRERASQGRKRTDRDALSVNAVPVLYATPPPLPQGHEWSKWMMDPAHTNAPLLLRPSSPFMGMSEASTPTTTKTTAT